MKAKHFLSNTAPVICAAILFILIYGVRVLNPAYDDWLYSGNDLTQHYLGYQFYLKSDWGFPVIGKTEDLCWPRGISVIYTDSIPLVSFFCKLFRSVLPEHFQLFGIYSLLNFCLMAFFGARLLKCFIQDNRYVLAGSIFFTMAPVFLNRLFLHTSLSSEWLILWGLYIGIRLTGNRSNPSALHRLCAELLLLGFTASSIHIYLLVMVTISVFSASLVLFVKSHGWKEHLYVLFMWILYLFVCVATIYLFGAFETNRDSVTAGGLGEYTFNLNGFFNPMGWSRFLPDLSYYGAGAVTYIGLGVILLFIFAAAAAILNLFRNRLKTADSSLQTGRMEKPVRIYLLLTAVLSFLISQSPVIALDGEHYLILTLPQWFTDLWSVVRDTERFIWTVIYILMFVSLVLVWNLSRKKTFPRILICILLAVQVVDISGQLETRHETFTAEVTHEPYQDNTLETLVSSGSYLHICFTSNRTENLQLMYTIGEFSIRHDLTMNMFYTAHNARITDAVDNAAEELDSPREDTLYIFKAEGDEALMAEHASQLHYYQFDQGYVGVVNADSSLTEVYF